MALSISLSVDHMTTYPREEPSTLTPIQLDKYLRRINIRGDEAVRLCAEEPSLANLQLLIARHIQAVSFENIDLHSHPSAGSFPEIPRKWVPLSPSAAYHKIVDLGRGGFCYEINFAWTLLLRSLNYSVRLVVSQVASPEGMYGPVASHVTPIVSINGKEYVADAGFGRHVREPVILDPGVVTTDTLQSEYTIAESTTEAEPNYPYVLMHRRGLGSRDTLILSPTPSIPGVRYTVEDLLDMGWVRWYRLDPTLDLELSSPLFEKGLKHVQTSPTTWFTQTVLCSRSMENGQLTLSRDNLTVTTNERVEKIPINGHEKWRQALKEHFDIELIPNNDL